MTYPTTNFFDIDIDNLCDLKKIIKKKPRGYLKNNNQPNTGLDQCWTSIYIF
jgi:hypothetical protein